MQQHPSGKANEIVKHILYIMSPIQVFLCVRIAWV